jgi:hypothetical protein
VGVAGGTGGRVLDIDHEANCSSSSRSNYELV